MIRIILAIAFATSFGLMFLGIILALHSPFTWTGIMVSFAGLISFWRFLPETNREGL